jgi:hypothetical protein
MPNPSLPEIKEELKLNVMTIENIVGAKKSLVRDDLIDLRDSLMDSVIKVQKIQDMLAH